jgi:alpha-galactosidase/6-phospho-beta-glucosidase family protein
VMNTWRAAAQQQLLLIVRLVFYNNYISFTARNNGPVDALPDDWYMTTECVITRTHARACEICMKVVWGR